MKVIISNLPKSRKELKIEVSIEEFEKFKQQTVSDLARDLKVEGFRPGKVPVDMASKTLGPDVILKETTEKTIKESYKKAVLENNIFPLGQPEVEVQKLFDQKPFEFKITVAVFPEIKLSDYKKIASEFKSKPAEVTEKEVEDSMIWLQKSRSKFSLKEGPAQKGDFVEIEYGSLQMEAGKKYHDAFILGEGRFVPGFEENLQNTVSGQEKKFSVKFPEDYSQKNLAGKNVEFDLKVKAVQKMELPDLNDEFAKSLGSFENLGALRESVKKGLLAEKENNEKNKARGEILEKITKNSTFEVPEVLVDSEKARIFEDLKKRVESQLKVPFENYLQNIKKSEKDLLNSFSEQAKSRVESSLVLREIGKKEEIDVTEEELNQEVSRAMSHFPDIKTAEKNLDLEDFREYTKEAIRNEKTFKLLESFSKKT